MLRFPLLLSVLGWCAVMAGCSGTYFSYIKHSTCFQRRKPSEVPVYFTERAVPRPYRVVARYEVHSYRDPMPLAVRRIQQRVAWDGGDAALVVRANGTSRTVWSWLFLLVPFTEHAKNLEVVAIRFPTPPGGGS